MTNLRFIALEKVISRVPKQIEYPSDRTSEYYGSNTFNKSTMREFLSEEAYDVVLAAIDRGEKIDRKIADQIASSLKAWSISKGATHYTHWFQPLTGTTAEKHDGFFTPVAGGRAIENFEGSQLIQQEPDASSFPNGGIRNTFEARGYTAWDPTSPAFIIDRTLCIPTIFVSYTGESLDNKTPLLKAIKAIDKAAVEVARYFDKNVNKVSVSLGWEQEYFLVDTALFKARPDLVLTERTLFGHIAAKNQQLDDHYFGVIPERVLAYMKELEIESHKLGIPLKTRHNEVAPSQFECAPVFEEVNLAVDHNQLLMHLMDKLAKSHNLTVLLHEKPYAGINGSGKHNNWSLRTDTGVNLLSPGKTPKENFRFLTILINILKGLTVHADVLRASIATASNDHRLGANEAPPAIISSFIGEYLTKTLDAFEKNPNIVGVGEKLALSGDFAHIPEILLDNTDRNRTSPFAFTGNRFEFRAVGSSANCAVAMTALNTIVADQLKQFKVEVDGLIAAGAKKEDALIKVLQRLVTESKNIRFEGNGYSEEWTVEAAKRGLSNLKTTPPALAALVTKSAIKLFEDNDVLSEREIEARYEIQLENYIKKIQIEARVIGDLAINHILPVAIRYQNVLVENIKGLKGILDDKEFKLNTSERVKTINTISKHIEAIQINVEKCIEARIKANDIEDYALKAAAYDQKVKPFFDVIRESVDELEQMVDDELWPLPKYRELLFVK